MEEVEVEQSAEGRVLCKPSGIPGAGRGLYAARSFKQGEVIFTEKPLSAMQSLENAQQVLVCRRCLTFVGGLRLQLAVMSKGRQECLEDAHIAQSTNFCGVCATGTPTTSSSAEVQMEIDAGARYTVEVTACSRGCGEVYCSTRCMSQHWEECHKLVCVGHVSAEDAEVHPLVRLKTLAAQTNEIIVVVLDILASITQCPQKASSYASFIQNPWWEVAIPGDGDDAALFRSKLRELCEDVSSLWVEAMGGAPEDLKYFYSGEYIGRLIGLFEQNQLGMRRESPLVSWFAKLGESSIQPTAYNLDAYIESLTPLLRPLLCNDESDCAQECGSNVVPPEQIADEYELDSLFPALDGTAIFSDVCTMNHSCCAPCRIEYVGGSAGQPLKAAVVASEDIHPGQELLFSYIDETMHTDDRRKALEDYGFVCKCSKCMGMGTSTT